MCAKDEYSGKVVAFITMLIKNNVEIYEHLNFQVYSYLYME